MTKEQEEELLKAMKSYDGHVTNGSWMATREVIEKFFTPKLSEEKK